MIDNSESKQADSTSSLYRLITSQARDIILLMYKCGSIIEANEAAVKAYGYQYDELLRMNISDLRDPSTLAEMPWQMLQADAKGILFETQHKRKDGSLFPVEVSSRGTTIDGKRVLLSIIRDITERKRSEERLRKANRNLVALSRCNEALIHAANEAELLANICRIIVETGGYQLVWVGYAEQDAEKTVRPAAYWGKDDGYLDAVKVTWDESETGRGPSGCAIRSGKPSICRNILTAPSFRPWRDNASRRGFCSSVAIPLIAESRTLGTLNIYSTEENAFDGAEVEMLEDLAANLAFGITSLRAHAERAQARQVIQESENLYRAIFENTGTAMIIIEEDTYISLSNFEFEMLFGYRKDEIVGKMSWTELISEGDLENALFQHKLRRIDPEHALRSYEIRARDKMNNIHDILLHVDIINGTKRSVASLTDITEIKKAEKKLKHYSGQLEELVQERTQQLRDKERLAAVGETAMMIGHDLRNPLQAVVTTIYLAKAKLECLSLSDWMNLDKLGLMDDLATVEKQSEYMNKIVSDLQDCARPLSLDKRTQNLSAFVNDVLAGVRIPQNVEVQRNIDEQLAWTVDPILMDRVLINLFNNALQAMPQGGILTIDASKTCHQIILTIGDTGVGISPEILPRIFQPLVTTKSKGMGIGLVVCKRLLEAQGAEITIESELNHGTVVIIKIAS
jgi:PAS domain S-box-containing protein